MPNMSHCMFENTSNDLEDCLEKLGSLDLEDVRAMSKHERRGLVKLFRICCEISHNYDEYAEAAQQGEG
jgi:hypothetical protein